VAGSITFDSGPLFGNRDEAVAASDAIMARLRADLTKQNIKFENKKK
jgi:hypothetical protein